MVNRCLSVAFDVFGGMGRRDVVWQWIGGVLKATGIHKIYAHKIHCQIAHRNIIH